MAKKAVAAGKSKARKMDLAGTLKRGLAMLQCVGQAREASILDIADRLTLSRSTVYRIADDLRGLGYLEVNARTGRFRLGSQAIQLGVAALQSSDIMQIAPGMLQFLLETTRESVNLAVFDTDSMILVYREQGPQSVTISSRLGSRRPMHASGLGKAFLSAMKEAERKTLIARLKLERCTPHTQVTARDLERDIAAAQKRGYTIDRMEFEATLACCAAPVYDHRAVPIATISVSGPAERIIPQVERIGTLVAETAGAISKRLGYIDTSHEWGIDSRLLDTK